MSSKFYSLDKVLSILRETPLQIADLTNGVPPGQLHTPPESGEWSVNEVLAHLRSCADVWGGCIMKILAEDKPSYKAVSPRTYIKKTNYNELDFLPSFEAFTTQRNELVKILEALPPESWERAATVSDSFGRAFENSILYYGDRMARHERGHIKQIEKTLSIVCTQQ